jgi:hypothetical protein
LAIELAFLTQMTAVKADNNDRNMGFSDHNIGPWLREQRILGPNFGHATPRDANQ